MPLRREPIRPVRRRALGAALLVCAFCLFAPLASSADPDTRAFVPTSLLQAATANPDAAFKVIVQGTGTSGSAAVATDVRGEVAADPGKAKGLARKFASISGVSAELTGKQILKLAKKKSILAITADAPVRLTDASGAPVNAAPPTISGTAQEGQPLTAVAGVWTGLSPLAYGYQWQVCGSNGRSPAVVQTAPTNYWRLSEGAGTSAVDAAGGLSGAYVGAVAHDVAGVTGGADTAAGFDGSTGYVDVRGVADSSFSSGFTLEAWVKVSTVELNRAIAGKWSFPAGGMLLWIDDAGNYGLAATADAANYVTTLVPPTPGVWEHIVGTWDGTTLHLYRNGAEIGSKPFSGPLGSPTADFEIANYDGLQHHLNGSVDEVALYSRALSSSEIGTHYLGCLDIASATNPTFVPTTSDIDSTLRVAVTATNGAGSSSASSDPTAPILPAPPPPPAPVALTNITPPAISGTAQDGVTLTSTTGTWTGVPTDYSYRWRRCDATGLACSDIAGPIGSTYTLTPADVGATVRVAVTAAGAAGEATSDASPVVVQAPPSNVSPPTLAGAPVEGVAVTSSSGTWNGTAPLSYSYRWQLCDATGLACTDIAGATEATYVPVAANVGSTLRVVVSARNSASVTAAPSNASALVAMGTGYSSTQLWPYETGVAAFWPKASSGELQPPTIAIVDSGIDATRADFGNRVIQQVSLTSLTPNSPGDGYGHGTFVASVAAGEAHGHTGPAPNAKLVSLDVMDDSGMATVSDVIAAADWIYQNKDANNIRVANFSLTGTVASSVRYDPLDKAVEKLWLSGVVVVAAAGNYAQSGAESGVLYAPANDPFVITVGAQDLVGTLTSADDVTAPWSAWGYTPDGFAKPELSAPGRYMVGAVSPTSTLAVERPAQIVEPGYMQLSGTSFAAPVVTGTAAELLAAHPTWTPDQVKGALMLAAQPLPLAAPRSAGVGGEDAAKALAVTDPPNPNLAIDQYLIPDPSGSPIPVFDTAAWGQAASANAAWGQAAWGQAAWGQAAWGQAAWGQSYWSSAAWGQGSDAGSNTPTSNADGDVLSGGGYWISPAELAEARAALGLG